MSLPVNDGLHGSYSEMDQESGTNYHSVLVINFIQWVWSFYLYHSVYLLIDTEPDASLSSGIMSLNGVSTIPASELEERWGQATHLGGLLSSICIFSEPISSGNANTLFHYGTYSCLHLPAHTFFLSRY